MSEVQVDSLCFGYDSCVEPVLSELTVAISAGELLCVLGTSGSGKSTLLHLLAGLLEPSSGDIAVAGRSNLGVPPHKRQIILLSQKALLFPFATVEGNIEFSPRLRRQSRRQRKQRVLHLLKLVGLAGYENRQPDSLSGGESQRVALARALAADPKVLLMDEPFSNLDASIRAELQRTFRRLHDQQGLTTIFVTHQLDEAMALGDRIACLVDGDLQMIAEPAQVYTRPATTGVARLVGVEHWLEGDWKGDTLMGPWGSVKVSEAASGKDTSGEDTSGEDTVIAARPEHLLVRPRSDGLEKFNNLEFFGTVVDVDYRGSHYDVRVCLAGDTFVQGQAVPGRAKLVVGQKVVVEAKPDAWFQLKL